MKDVWSLLYAERCLQSIQDTESDIELTLFDATTPETIFTCFKPETKFADGFFSQHEVFLSEYRQQNWQAAKAMIQELTVCPNELGLYYAHMSARIEEYIINPPPLDWEGVYVAKNK